MFFGSYIANAFSSSIPAILLILHLISPSPHVSAQSLPPWSFETMYWGWDVQNNTWTQCRMLQLQWWQIPGTSPAMKAPYSVAFYLEGYEPHILSLGSGTPKGKDLTYNWTVDLPTGGPYQASLTDANGATAGVSFRSAPQ
jgi:hypothetical protein